MNFFHLSLKKILETKIFCHFEDSMKELVDKEFFKVDPENKFETVLLRDCEMILFEK